MRYQDQIRTALAALAPEERYDANETAALARELEHVSVEVIETEYPENMWDTLPSDTSVEEGAQTYVWYESDTIGIAKTIALYASDLPLVEIFLKKNISPIQREGIAYQYDVEELRASAKLGRPLDASKAALAREGMERRFEHVMVKGDPDTNRPGFAKASGVSIVDGSSGVYNGDWDAIGTTGQMIYDDLNNMYWSMVNASYGKHRPTRIDMGRVPFQYANTKSMTTLDSTSALAKFREAQPGVEVRLWSELDLVDAGNDGPRIVVYENNPKVLCTVVPIRFRSYPPQPKHFFFEVPAEGKIGGCVIKRPLGMLYVDNILD